jgi:hypothetical protein
VFNARWTAPPAEIPAALRNHSMACSTLRWSESECSAAPKSDSRLLLHSGSFCTGKDDVRCDPADRKEVGTLPAVLEPHIYEVWCARLRPGFRPSAGRLSQGASPTGTTTDAAYGSMRDRTAFTWERKPESQPKEAITDSRRSVVSDRRIRLCTNWSVPRYS